MTSLHRAGKYSQSRRQMSFLCVWLIMACFTCGNLFCKRSDGKGYEKNRFPANYAVVQWQFLMQCVCCRLTIRLNSIYLVMMQILLFSYCHVQYRLTRNTIDNYCNQMSEYYIFSIHEKALMHYGLFGFVGGWSITISRIQFQRRCYVT